MCHWLLLSRVVRLQDENLASSPALWSAQCHSPTPSFPSPASRHATCGSPEPLRASSCCCLAWSTWRCCSQQVPLRLAPPAGLDVCGQGGAGAAEVQVDISLGGQQMGISKSSLCGSRPPSVLQPFLLFRAFHSLVLCGFLNVLSSTLSSPMYYPPSWKCRSPTTWCPYLPCAFAVGVSCCALNWHLSCACDRRTCMIVCGSRLQHALTNSDLCG